MGRAIYGAMRHGGCVPIGHPGQSESPPMESADLERLQGEVRDLRKMLLIVIDHLATIEWNVGTTQSYALRLRAAVEETTTNAIIHEELREAGHTRALELLHDRYHAEAEGHGLADVAALFRDPSDPPRKRRRKRK